MVEGFWTVHYQGPLGSGGGVAVLVNGKFFGGDSGFTYIGTYEGDSVVKARILVRNFDPTIPNVLDIAGDFELHVSATVDGDTMNGTAALAGQPLRSVGLRLSKKADL